MYDVYAIFHEPSNITGRSGLFPLVEALGAHPVRYSQTWAFLQKWSWSLGDGLRRFGNRYYGSEWNALVPGVDECRIGRAVRGRGPGVVHFLWGEFASPRRPDRFRARDWKLVGTFHCSARRQPTVLADHRTFREFDGLTVMSKTQIPFFTSRGFPADRILAIPHGVDTAAFRPGDRSAPSGGPLKALLVGSTERDHAFAADVLNRLPDNTMTCSVCTVPEHAPYYRGVKNATLLPYLSGPDFVAAYRQADLLFMPLLDCTANNAILEAMACGTPVLTNRVGGIPEYVDPSCNFVTEGKNRVEWTSLLIDLARHRGELEARRPAVRAWAETFDWKKIAPQYLDFYRWICSE